MKSAKQFTEATSYGTFQSVRLGKEGPCRIRLRHCYIFSENTCKHLDSMSWAEMQETFYNCLDFCAVHDRLPYFYITGGDPILHPDFWQLLELLKTHSIPFTQAGQLRHDLGEDRLHQPGGHPLGGHDHGFRQEHRRSARHH